MMSDAGFFTRYPLRNVLVYNGLTVLHFALGGAGFFLAYPAWLGWFLAYGYLLFAFIEMYVVMPVSVCPRCPYYRLEKSLCVSGLNVLSRLLAKAGDIGDFGNRAKGLFCPNNLYLAGLVAPIVGLVPSLIIHFTAAVFGIFLALVGLLVLRFFVVFPKVACGRCLARNICPNAAAMKLGGPDARSVR